MQKKELIHWRTISHEEEDKMTTTENSDPDKRITNTDEQEVAVNQSTRAEGGYDEPASEREAGENPTSGKSNEKSSSSESSESEESNKRKPEATNSSDLRRRTEWCAKCHYTKKKGLNSPFFIELQQR